ncbi:MAG: tetratricopeptide repeat protein, partial [Gammaproteobacteria bacterium]|nr:tetratricopeptide repeat protein [Gammaproteobacteria bacterium]
MKKIALLLLLIAFNGYADNHNTVSNTQPPATVKTAVVVNNTPSNRQKLQLDNQAMRFQLQLQSMKNLQDKFAENAKYQDLRKNVLDSRESSIDWWLTAIGIFLAIFGVIGFLVANNKIKEFDRLNQAAKKELNKTKKYRKQAKGYKKKASKHYKKLVDPKSKLNKQTIKEIEQSGTKLEKQILKARELEDENKIEEAIALWQRIIGVAKYTNDDEQLSDGYFNLGYLYDELKKYQKAIDAYKKAIKAKTDIPDKHVIYYNMGITYEKLKKYRKAINTYKQAIEIKHNYHEAYSNMGDVYDKLKKYRKAINACKKAIKIKSDFHEAYYNMGIAYEKLKNYRKA